MYQVKLIKSVLDEDIPKLKKSGINLEALYRSIKKLETNPYGSSRAKTGDCKELGEWIGIKVIESFLKLMKKKCL